jgi:phage replication-related protein YjqB (UPF0714/DUF867 family)
LYTVVQPDDFRWHIPSHLVDPDASAALHRFLGHIEVAIALHGYGREGRWRQILCGGSNRQVATTLAAAIEAGVPGYTAVADLDDIPRELRGLHPLNPVNLPVAGGVQVELPPGARGCVPPGLPKPLVPVAGLVDALVTAAASWPT